jgi:hypothetical protein
MQRRLPARKFAGGCGSMLSLSLVGKNAVDILPSVEHTYNFGPIFSDTIEHDMGIRRERPKTRSQFIS